MIDAREPSRKLAALFVLATSQSPGLPETLATAYNPGMCLLALPVIAIKQACRGRIYSSAARPALLNHIHEERTLSCRWDLRACHNRSRPRA